MDWVSMVITGIIDRQWRRAGFTLLISPGAELQRAQIILIIGKIGEPAGVRSRDPLIKSQMLYR